MVELGFGTRAASKIICSSCRSGGAAGSQSGKGRESSGERLNIGRGEAMQNLTRNCGWKLGFIYVE